ncbi:hypothetical protein CVT24_007748 [Panaeolus cyanescens]|uniref:Chromo domain-containing protein n=1 Tax=Panaeolus cyanescens TaxID=181874 RepID=A0A409YKS7_9AGAR|nr:hypothetical protein CVT24_007748 [Panaeolus cyanescens]
MSDGNESEEYEVESIIEAKVDKEGPSRKRKKPKLVWSYRVRWKGYKPEEDTWEPAESFQDSPDILNGFWSRVSTNGRDKDDLRLFRYGEVVFPSGPPGRKKSSTSLKAGPSEPNKNIHKPESPQSSQATKRRRSPDLEIVEPTPAKKAREASVEIVSPPRTQNKRKAPITPQPSTSNATSTRPRSQRRKVEKPPSPEIIPPSDGELDEDTLSKPFFSATKPTASIPNSSKQQNITPTSTISKRVALPELPAKPRSSITRSRVEGIVEPDLAVPDGALSAKIKATRQSQQSNEASKEPTKRMKAGPGRSSSGFIAKPSTLLTSDKGTLKSVRRRNTRRNVEDPQTDQPEVTVMKDEAPAPVVPPSGEELLQVAGLCKDDAENLEDFDEDMEDVQAVAAAVVPAEEPRTPDIPSSTPLSTRVQRASEQLFPSSRHSEPDVDANLLKTSTIFGPLGLGLSSPQTPQPSSHLVALSLDSSLSIPITIHDASNSVFQNSESTFNRIATPGKFYNTSAGGKLLATVRANGACARVELAEDAADEDKKHYSLFSSRLHEGDLFVAFTGLRSWVFCSSSNTLASQRLNIPSHLLNESKKILMSNIEVVNYNGYADAAADADGRRWLQYVALFQSVNP